MFSTRTAPVLLGIVVLSGMFLMGQETWGPPPVDDSDIQIGLSSQHYLDPEFIDVNGQYKAVFTEGVHVSGSMWVADMDPVTGDFVSGDGLDLELDTDIPPIYDTLINGPEWGVDAGGVALFYTKYDADQNRQVWRARLSDPPVLAQLTNDPEGRVHWAATLNRSDPSIHIFLVNYSSFELHWANEEEVTVEHPLPGYVWGEGNNGPRFIPGTAYFVYAKQISEDKVELVRVDTSDGSETVVTDDDILKVDTWGFIAPEFDNEICYSALISKTAIGVYRYVNPGDPFATRIAEIEVPAGDSHPYIRSIEILQTASGLFDRTYFAFMGADNPTPLVPCDGTMWVASLGPDPGSRFVRRVDEGAVSGRTAYRQEPELMIGQDEVFLYYNSYREGGIKELRRCRTGIPVNP